MRSLTLRLALLLLAIVAAAIGVIYLYVIPPLTSDFLNVFKNSAVALTIGLMELTGQTRQLSEFSAHPFEAFIASTLIYMAVTYCVVATMRLIEKRSRVPGLLGAA